MRPRRRVLSPHVNDIVRARPLGSAIARPRNPPMPPNADTLAADDLHARAGRLRASAAGRPDEAERLRRADVMQQLAALCAQGADAVRAALGEPGQPAGAITPEDRQRAGEAVYALALQRQEQGMQRNLGVAPQPGWEPGGHGLPIHRATLRESARLYALALALHYDDYWQYSRGLLHEALGEYDEAVRILESLRGPYAEYGPKQAARCRAKRDGTWDGGAEMAAAMDGVLKRGKGLRGWLTRLLFGSVMRRAGRQLDEARARPYPGPPPGPDAAPLDAGTLDRARDAAQAFAEHLADGDFDAARALLARELQATDADALRAGFESMMGLDGDVGDDGEAPGETVVMVMGAEADMPDMSPDDLGWVYVALTNEIANEAVTVVVTDEDGQARIRTLEWGRP